MSGSTSRPARRGPPAGAAAGVVRVGDTVGSIRILGTLGAGGMGEVYVGFDEVLRRKVALKAIAGRQRLSAEARARFLREARILSQLEHPNVCAIHDYIEQGDAQFLVLELIEGETLGEAVAAGLTRQQALRIARDLAAVLAVAHEAGIVHRDLKPGNVMLTPAGEIKVLDFGLARPERPDPPAGEPEAGRQAAPAAAEPSDGDATLPLPSAGFEEADAADRSGPLPAAMRTLVGTVVGTPLYMSPEQARGEPATTAGDMYSFGLLLQAIFTGRGPLEPGLSPWQQLERAQRGETLPVSGVDAELAALIRRLKSPAPAARPTAATALERLDWILDRPKRRARWLTALAAVVVLAAGGLKYTLDLDRERTAAVAARNAADQRRDQAEDLISFMLGDLRDKLAPVGRLEILDDVGDKAMDYFAAVSEEELAPGELLGRSKALYQIGEVRISQGNLEGALRPLEESLALARRLADQAPGDGERLFGLGQSLFWVGYVHWRRGQLDEALGYFKPYLAIARALTRLDPANSDWQIELASAHSNIGSILQEQGDLAGALEEFRACLEIERATLAGAPGNPEWRRAVAASHNTIGVVLRSQGRPREALEEHAAELAIMQALVEAEPQDMRRRRYLAVSHSFMGHTLEALGDMPAALRQFRAAGELFEEVAARDPTHLPWQRDLAVNRMRIGYLLQLEGELEAALEHFRGALASLARLTAADPSDSGWRLDLARAQARLGGGLLAAGRPRRAAELAERSLEAVGALLESSPGDRAALAQQGRGHALLGRAWAQRGDPGRARRAWESALASFEAAAAQTAEDSLLAPRVEALLELDRNEEAQQLIDRLTAMGYRGPDLVGLSETGRPGRNAPGPG